MVGDRVVLLDPPYALDKAGLLSVAYRLRCRAVQRVRYVDGEKQIRSYLFGYDSDLVRAEVLYMSLLLQATSTPPAPCAVRRARRGLPTLLARGFTGRGQPPTRGGRDRA